VPTRITTRHLREPELARQPALVAEMVDIVLATFEGPTREMVEQRVVFREPDANFALFERGDQLIGFVSYLITRVEVDGRSWGVLDAGAYLRPDARGLGVHIAQRIVLHALRFKLRHLATPLCCVGIATTPAAYRLASKTVPALTPRPGSEPAPHIARLVDTVMRQRGYQQVDGDPFRVHVGMTIKPRDEARLDRFVQQAASPAVPFFVQRNPGYRTGHWLVVHIPMGLRDLSRAVTRFT
jgi:hypothetical protein